MNDENWLQKTSELLDIKWSEKAFIAKTIAQINKDFLTVSNREINLEEIEESRLKDSLCEKIEELLILIEKESPSLLPQLMYTIDLPEIEPESIITDYKSTISNRSELILLREALKVWTREKYSAF